MAQVQIPPFDLRDYQQPRWDFFIDRIDKPGMTRLAFVDPRRSGKDTVTLQMMCAYGQRHVCNLAYLFPEKETIKKAIWRGVNHDGQKILDLAFPHELRASTNNSEMFIEFKNGSTITFSGSDRYDSLVGSAFRAVCFSEWALSNPLAFDYIRPMLAAQHSSLALFPFTPRGRNHGYDLFRQLEADPNSYAQLLTCDDTRHMSQEALALERQEMSEGLFMQEYYGSWDYGSEYAIYAKQLAKMRDEGRICPVPYDHALPLWAAFDIGLNDSTAIWLFHVKPSGQVLFVDYYENRNQQIAHYDQHLRELALRPQTLFFPHDADHHRLGMADSVIDQFRQLGWDCRMLPQERSTAPGIERVRVALAKSYIDEERCDQGVKALNSYRYEYDEKAQRVKDKPVHDWASDPSDAMRYACQAISLGYCVTELWGDEPDYSQLNRAAI